MKITIALAFIMILNVTLFLGQVAVTNAAEEEGGTPTIFLDYENSPLSDYDAGNQTYIVDDEVASKLPTGQGQIEPQSGNFFTDTFATIKNWFLDVTGIKYLIGIVNAFPNFLKNMGLPIEVSYAIGALWHAITFFLVIAFIKGNW